MKKINIINISFAITATLLLSFAAASVNTSKTKNTGNLRINKTPPISVQKTAAPKMMASVRASDAAPVYMDASMEEAATAPVPAVENFQRKLIYTGDVFVESEDLISLQSSVENWCKSYGGYIASSSCGQRNVNFTVKIPAEKFEQAMAETGSFGDVKNKNINTNDVTDEYYDLTGRLETRKLLKSKLEGYLKQSGSLQDLLKIERELNSVQSDIESMEGRLKRLTNRIDFSTINIYGNLPYNASPEGGFEWPDVKEGFRHFVSSTVGFFAGLLTVLLYLVVCGIPVLAVVALLYWLLFGKIGLLIKLYKLLHKE